MGRSYEEKNARITDRCYRANGYEEQYLTRSFHFKGSRLRSMFHEKEGGIGSRDGERRMIHPRRVEHR